MALASGLAASSRLQLQTFQQPFSPKLPSRCGLGVSNREPEVEKRKAPKAEAKSRRALKPKPVDFLRFSIILG